MYEQKIETQRILHAYHHHHSSHRFLYDTDLKPTHFHTLLVIFYHNKNIEHTDDRTTAHNIFKLHRTFILTTAHYRQFSKNKNPWLCFDGHGINMCHFSDKYEYKQYGVVFIFFISFI